MKTKYNLATFIETRRAAESVEIDLPDGTSVAIPPPYLWPDAIGPATDRGEIVRLILGDDAAERFAAAGGNYRILNAIWEDAQGQGMGEAAASPAS